MSVADVDAERVFRCGFRLAEVAEDVRTAAARTSHAYPDDWCGEAHIAYQQRLDATADRVRRMSVAYDAAGSILIQYAQAVLEAQQIWRRSESLLAEADAADRAAAAAAAAQGVGRLAGPSRAEGLRATAYRLQEEAAALEHRAALACAGNLDDEAARAPATSRWRSADRFLGDLAVSGAQMVAGAANLLKDGWQSLPGVGGRHSRHEARHQLAESAVAALSVWQIPIELGRELEDDRPGLAAGELLGVLSPARIAKLDKLRLRDLTLAEELAYRDADVQARRAATLPRAVSAAELTANGFDPLNEEIRGGHTLQEHVARPPAYLHYRNARNYPLASSFNDEPSARRLVNAVLEFHSEEVAALYGSSGPRRVVLHASFDEVTGYYAKTGAAATFPARGVLVVVALREGAPYVVTAYPTP